VAADDDGRSESWPVDKPIERVIPIVVASRQFRCIANTEASNIKLPHATNLDLQRSTPCCALHGCVANVSQMQKTCGISASAPEHQIIIPSSALSGSSKVAQPNAIAHVRCQISPSAFLPNATSIAPRYWDRRCLYSSTVVIICGSPMCHALPPTIMPRRTESKPFLGPCRSESSPTNLIRMKIWFRINVAKCPATCRFIVRTTWCSWSGSLPSSAATRVRELDILV
jgi:hypothetical protein